MVLLAFRVLQVYVMDEKFCFVNSRRMRWAGHVARMGEDIGGAQGVGGEA